MNAEATPLFRSLQIQRRVLFALLMREIITRFGRENIGVLWLAGEPMLFTVGVATLWAASGLHHGSPIPIVAFAVTGYSAVLMWRNSASRAGAAIQQNKALLYHHNVRIIDVILTRIVVEITGATCSFIVLAAAFTFVGWMPLPADPLQVVFGWLMLAWCGIGLSLIIGAGSAFSEIVERLWHPAAYLLFPISGAAFMVEWLPASMQRVVMLIPMVHGTEMLRQGFFGNVVRTHYDVGYMAGCCLIMSLIGLYLVQMASRRVEF